VLAIDWFIDIGTMLLMLGVTGFHVEFSTDYAVVFRRLKLEQSC
jgi:hypothetical protein